MQCPLCNIEAAIAGSRYVVKNDTSAEAETKLYVEQDMKCRNSNCSNYNKIFDTVQNELPVSQGTVETQ
jgi:hypothetical protein